MKNLFKNKVFYIVLTVVFSLLIVADAAVAIAVPSMSGFGGNMPFNGGMPDMEFAQMPDTDSGEMPNMGSGEAPDFDPENMPDMSSGATPDTDSGEMPNMGSGEAPDFDPENMPDMSSGEMPDMDFSNMPNGFDKSALQQRGGNGFLSAVKKLWIPLMVIFVLCDGFSIFMLVRTGKKSGKKETATAPSDEGQDHTERPSTKNKKSIWTVVVCVVLCAAIVIMLLPTNSSSSSVEIVEETLSAEAENCDITKQLITGGSLEDTATESVSFAGNIKVTSWNVIEGDYVEQGQLIAQVDLKTVLSAIADINEQLARLDEALEEYRGDTVDSTVTAPTAGRVKAIYAQSGDDIVDVMYCNGALIRLSLDGRMVVEIDAGELSAGSVVNVILSDGTELQGTVYDVTDGIAAVTVSDASAPYLDSVTVLDDSGRVLGEGELDIHSEVLVTGYAGTVSKVNTSLNASVSEGSTLITLSDSSYSGSYNTLCDQRSELEQQLAALIEVYQTGAVYAPCNGRITDLNEDMTADSLSAGGGEYVISLLGNEPQGGMPEGGNDQPATVTFYGKVKDITQVEGGGKQFVIEPISSGSEMTLKESDLEGKLGNKTADDIKKGSILEFTYLQESGELLSVTIYGESSDSGSGKQSDWGDITGGGSFSFGTTTTEDDDEEEELPDFSMSESELCSIVLYDTAEISATVDELDIKRISIGQTVTVMFDALPGQSFEAQISDIDTNGENNGGNTKYTVTASLARTQQMLSGMNASIYINFDSKENILAIPLAAVCEDENGSFVYTSYDEKNDELTSPVYIRTGISDGEKAEIVSGLSAGDTVYYKYADSIKYSFST